MNTLDRRSYRLLQPAARIDGDLRAAWLELQAGQPQYASPYFHVDFAAAVVAAGVPIEVGVERSGGEIVSIFPFQRVGQNSARPIGAGLNDAHGVLKHPERVVDWQAWLGHNQLRDFEFHSAVEQSQVKGHVLGESPAFLANLACGYDSYVDYLSHQHSTIARQGQKARKLQRQLGELRLEFDEREPRWLDLLMTWKSQQYQRTHLLDIFRLEWVRRLLHQLHQSRSELRGVLSVLTAGGTPVAMHFGLQLGDRLHYWYPTYDPQFGYGSPGTQLFLEIAKQAPCRGVSKVDFGYGEQPYKHTLCNERSVTYHGLVTHSAWRRGRYRTRRWLQQRMKRLWFKDTLKAWVRRCYPRWDQAKF